MKPFLDRLKRGEIIVADGAMGTMLMDMGLKSGEAPESWNLTHPRALGEIARAYFEAGAEIVQTNTFGASPMNLAEYKLDGATEEINRTAVEAVRTAVGDDAYVSGLCGPSGRILVPYGDTEPEVLRKGFMRQLTALIDAGVDIICVETMTDIHEATLAVETVKSISPDIPVMATMTFNKIPKGFYTIMGVSIQEAAEKLAAAGADVVGSNCGNGVSEMLEIAHGFCEATELPVIIQSNAGIPEFVDGAMLYLETPEVFSQYTPLLIDEGVSIIGGCCGTTPEHIRAVKAAVASYG